MVGEDQSDREWQSLLGHVRSCVWCLPGLSASIGCGLDGPPEGLCALGRVLERNFDLTRQVRCAWEAG